MAIHHGRHGYLVAAALVWASLSLPAFAQQAQTLDGMPRVLADQPAATATLGLPTSQSTAGLEERVGQLENLVKNLQSQGDAQSEASRGGSGGKTATEGKVPVAGWNEGFFLQSPDKKYVLRLTGQIQADYRGFLNENDTTDIDTFLLRRARFGLEANMFDHYEFRFLPDFGQGNAVIQDSYLNVHYWDAFQFETGKFRQPVSYEQLIQDRFVPTLERSIIDQLTPQRDIGAMIHGQKLFGDRLDYAMAVSNGQINGNADNNQFSDFNARVVVRPFNDPCCWAVLRGLQVGCSGGFGNEQEAVNPSTLKTPATVPWFQFNSTVREDGARTRLSPELAYFFGEFGFMAQYYRETEELRPALSGPTYPFRTNLPYEGYQILGSFLLTGETRTTYSQAIDPLFPFDPCHPFQCPGAWELIVRTSRLEVGDEAFVAGKARLADPTKWSSGATELTVGFNWYFNKWVRMQFNWEHAWFDDPVQLGVGAAGLLRHQDSLLTRFQIIF